MVNLLKALAAVLSMGDIRGKSFHFYGVANDTKQSLTKRIETFGGRVTYMFGKGTDVLVTTAEKLNGEPCYRLQKCCDLGILVTSAAALQRGMEDMAEREGEMQPEGAKHGEASPSRMTTGPLVSSVSSTPARAAPVVTMAVPPAPFPCNGSFQVALFGLDFMPTTAFSARLSSASDEVTTSVVEFHSSTSILCHFAAFLLPAGPYTLSCSNDGIDYGLGLTVTLVDKTRPGEEGTGDVDSSSKFVFLCSQLQNVRRAVESIQRVEATIAKDLMQLKDSDPNGFVAFDGELRTLMDPTCSRSAQRKEEPQTTSSPLPEPSSTKSDTALLTSSSTDMDFSAVSLPRNQLTVRSLRVFISSTFKDMQEERDLIVKIVMPQIRKMCMERDVVVNCVDLRWGITTAQSEQSASLLMCLRELATCNVFIGMLGERYGAFLPSGEQSAPSNAADLQQQRQIQQAFDLAVKEFPWVAQYRDRSITEVEMIYAMERYAAQMPEDAAEDGSWLTSSNSKVGSSTHPFPSLIFMRDSYFVEEVDAGARANFAAESEVAEVKMADLKARIEASSCQTVSYNRPSHFAELVLESLRGEVEAQFPDSDQLSPDAQESFRHLMFANSRSRVFIADEDNINALDMFVSGGQELPLCVAGPGGIGRSALVCNWAMRYAEHHPEDVVIQHYIGCSPNSTDPSRMVGRIIGQICGALDISPPDISDGNLDQFPVWLDRAFATEGSGQKRRVILVIDGLDNIQDRDNAHELIWFPRTFPRRMRVIVTARADDEESSAAGDCVAYKTLQARKSPTLTIREMNVGCRKSFCVQYLKTNHSKRLGEELELRIAQSDQTSNPRFLQTLLEDLSVSAVHDDLGKRVTELLNVDTTAQLYEKVIARMEGDYGSQLVRSLLCLLWASRIGLCMDDELIPALKILLGVSYIQSDTWPKIYLILETLTTNSGGLLSLANSDIRAAVSALYLRDPVEQVKVHHVLSTVFLEKLKDNFYTTRMLEELPWQLAHAKRLPDLRTTLCDVRMMDQFFTKRYSHDCAKYWIILQQNVDGLTATEAYRDVIKHATFPPTILRAELMFKLASFLQEMSQFEGAEEMLLLAKHHYENSSSTIEVCKVEVALANLFALQRKNTEARKWFEVALAKYERENADSIYVAEAMERLGTLFINMGQLAEAKEILERALALCEKRFGGSANVTADVIYSLGCVYLIDGRSGCGGLDQKKAEDWLRRSLDIKTRLLGDWHPEVARVLNRLGAIFVEQNQFNDAEACYRQALVIREEKQPGSTRVLQTLKHMISCYEMQESTEKALELCRKALQICETGLFHTNHPQTASILLRMGVIMWSAGDLSAGLAHLDRARRIRSASLGSEHKDTLEACHLCEELEDEIKRPPAPPPMPVTPTATAQPSQKQSVAKKIPAKPRKPVIRPALSGPPPPPPLPGVAMPKHVARAARDGQAVCNDVLDEIRLLRLNKGEMYDRSDARQQLESMIGARKRKIKLKKLK